MSFKKILCPVDFSDTSRAAVTSATELSQGHGATLTLFHVLAEAPRAVLGAMVGAHGSHGSAAAAAAAAAAAVPALSEPDERERSLLADWQREAIAAGANCLEVEVGWGDAADAILRLAQEGQFDLIVLGTHGKTGMLRSLLGTVTYKVVRNAPCSVLTIRSSQG